MNQGKFQFITLLLFLGHPLSSQKQCLYKAMPSSHLGPVVSNSLLDKHSHFSYQLFCPSTSLSVSFTAVSISNLFFVEIAGWT